MNTKQRNANLKTVRAFVAAKYPSAEFWGIYSDEYTFQAGSVFVQINLETGRLRRRTGNRIFSELKVAV